MLKTISRFNKIYIIGVVGSGKTTLAAHLSKQLDIPYYSLDNLIYDDNNIKRKNEEVEKLFSQILSKNNFIIEDVGRGIFNDGIKKVDVIIYLDIKKRIIKRRIFTRWLKQKFKIEKTNYKPDIKMLKLLYKWVREDINKTEEKISFIKSLNKNVIILNEKDLNSYIIEKKN